jgi:hypothetical protein
LRMGSPIKVCADRIFGFIDFSLRTRNFHTDRTPPPPDQNAGARFDRPPYREITQAIATQKGKNIYIGVGTLIVIIILLIILT